MSSDWQQLGHQTLLEHSFFRLEQLRMRSPRNGVEHDFIRMQFGDWVNGIALTEDRQVVMIRQWRPGLDAVTLEVPGGAVDSGEDPADTIRRELAEETGYTGGELTHLGSVNPNPALLTNKLHMYLIEGVRDSGTRSLDETEDIAVELMSLQRVGELIATGEIQHAMVLSAFCRLYQQQPEVLGQ